MHRTGPRPKAIDFAANVDTETRSGSWLKPLESEGEEEDSGKLAVKREKERDREVGLCEDRNSPTSWLHSLGRHYFSAFERNNGWRAHEVEILTRHRIAPLDGTSVR